MKILKLKHNNIIEQTIQTLRHDGLVIFPSDTVYGLLVDASNEKAVQKLIQFKNRPSGKPISVFVANFKMLEEQVKITNAQKQILNTLIPGPFTIIFQSKHKVSRSLESEKGTLGIRIPMYQLINRLIQSYAKPITATSANLSGRSSHYNIETLLKDLPDSKKQLVDLVIDAGKLSRNKPSTIIDFSQTKLKILRHGDVVIKNKEIYISKSTSQSVKLGEYFISKFMVKAKTKPLVIVIEGDLGVGKTVLVKGMGKYFGINNIISPTYVIFYEYKINKQDVINFYHFDLYNIEEADEFKHLGINKLLAAGNILCFEWGEKLGEIYKELKAKSNIVHIKMKYVSEEEREITVTL